VLLDAPALTAFPIPLHLHSPSGVRSSAVPTLLLTEPVHVSGVEIDLGRNYILLQTGTALRARD
jgi:hypothetical protein